MNDWCSNVFLVCLAGLIVIVAGVRGIPQQGVWKTRCWAGLRTHVLWQAGDTGLRGNQWNSMAVGISWSKISPDGVIGCGSGCCLILKGSNILSHDCGLETMCVEGSRTGFLGSLRLP